MKSGDEEAQGIIWLVDELRKRGVSAVELKTATGFELKAAIQPPVERPLSENEKKALIASDLVTPERVAELTRELEGDLYGAS